MVWHRLDTQPLDFDSGLEAGHAMAIAQALVRRVLPLMVLRDGRAEPLATATLYRVAGRVLLLTCRHMLDEGVALGDLVIPLPGAGSLLRVQALAPRAVEDPQQDCLALFLPDTPARARLLRHWPPVPLSDHALREPQVPGNHGIYVLAGYPYVQMRRTDLELYARPVVFFARRRIDQRPFSIGYGRIARRWDGADVHAPALDGVSGATCWAFARQGATSFPPEDREPVAAGVLTPVAVQSAFKHDAYARGEPLAGSWEVFAQVIAC
jgi:hypothetical protein